MKENNKILVVPDVEKIGVYAIHNKVTDRYYIGSSLNIKKRLQQHRGNILNNGGVNVRMASEILKDGDEENFEFLILETFENGTVTETQLRESERYYIKLYKADTVGYNSINHTPLESIRNLQNDVFLKADTEEEQFKKYMKNNMIYFADCYGFSSALIFSYYLLFYFLENNPNIDDFINNDCENEFFKKIMKKGL